MGEDIERLALQDLDVPVHVHLHERLGVVAGVVPAQPGLGALAGGVAHRHRIGQNVVELREHLFGKTRRPVEPLRLHALVDGLALQFGDPRL